VLYRPIVSEETATIIHDEWMARVRSSQPVGRCHWECGSLIYPQEPDHPDWSPIIYYTATCPKGHEHVCPRGQYRGRLLRDPADSAARDITTSKTEEQ
jgi:hypothetical protein